MNVDDVERQHTLLTAAHRYDDLRLRHTLLGSNPNGEPHPDPDIDPGDSPRFHLPMHEALELLALAEVLARKASYGRQLAVRSARSAGASWSQIAAATDMTKQSAWQAHNDWIEEQVAAHQAAEHEGFTPEDEQSIRRLTGLPD